MIVLDKSLNFWVATYRFDDIEMMEFFDNYAEAKRWLVSMEDKYEN